MTALIHPQLPLGFEPGELFTFDSFIAGKNSVVIGLAQQMAASDYSVPANSEQQLYIWGEQGLGKSHLLQACCNLAAKNKHTVCYLTQNEIQNQATDIFDGLEQIELVCLDDIDKWLVDSSWENALFDLINRMRESHHRLILASSNSPDENVVDLPDLRSRLAWGPVFHLHDISDKEKYQALSYRARQSGLELPENVADYLMKRYPRDMFGLFERLSVLDKASMAMQRRLTVPLVKSVFSDES